MADLATKSFKSNSKATVSQALSDEADYLSALPISVQLRVELDESVERLRYLSSQELEQEQAGSPD